MSVIDFLKSFPRNKRLEIVDMLRGAMPVPVDYNELKFIGNTIGMNNEEIFDIWETRLKQTLENGGMNLNSNSELIDKMIACAKKYTLNLK